MQFDIKNRVSGAVQFTAEIDCDESESVAVKIGLAVRWAFNTGAYLAGADLRGAYLRRADLRGVDLRGADLRDAHLRGACLRGSDLRGVDLGGADLRGAYLAGADLRGAYLRGAYLAGADLRDAHLRGAYLRGADLGDYKLAAGNSLAMLGTPDNWHAFTYLTDVGEQRIHVGCRDFTLSEARKYWAGKAGRREVLAAVEYAKAIGRARQWDSKKSEAA